MGKEWNIQEYDMYEGKWIDRTSRDHLMTCTEMMEKLDEIERFEPGAFRGNKIRG